MTRGEEARVMEGVENKLISKSVKKECKYCMCKNYAVRVCEEKSSSAKLEVVLVPKVGSHDSAKEVVDRIRYARKMEQGCQSDLV